MYEIALTRDDVTRVRFAISPLWEAMAAVRLIADPGPTPYHLPWLAAVRPDLDRVDLALLMALQPRRGYTPDFPAPCPTRASPSVGEQLAQVRNTSLDQVAAELQRALTDRHAEPVPTDVLELVRDPAATRTRVADALEQVWAQLIAPHWAAVQELLSADVAHHARTVAEHGLAHAVAGLHPTISWQGDSVMVDGPYSQRRQLDGGGLVLQPTVFAWPRVTVVLDEPLPPVLIYPARGIAELWHPVVTGHDEHLGRLLGRTRALLLASVQEPATTTTLARRHGLAQSTVSEHLTVLRSAGLVTARRNRGEVRYRTSPLGAALAAGVAGTGKTE